MMKWITIRYLQVLLVLICCLLTGCGKTNKSVLSVGLKSEVEEMWLKRTGRELSLDSESGYYGMYQGMVVFHSTPEQSAAEITEIVIAGQSFVWPSGFSIMAYWNGEFIYLEEAYTKGMLTQESIQDIAERHEEYLYMKTNWIPSE